MKMIVICIAVGLLIAVLIAIKSGTPPPPADPIFGDYNDLDDNWRDRNG